MSKMLNLQTVSQDRFSIIRRKFLHSFVNDEEFIQFAMSSRYNGDEKRNSYLNTSGLIWEQFSALNTTETLTSQALDYLKEKRQEYFLMITDAYEGRIANAESPVYIVTYSDIINALSYTAELWNLYLFDESMSWFVAITDENIGNSNDTLAFIGIKR